MNRLTTTALLAVLTGFATADRAAAQIQLGEFGFTLTGQNGSAGDACWAFDCTPRRLTVVRGESLTFMVRAPLNAPYLILASTGATMCLTFPGIQHQLVVDLPAITMIGGAVSQRNGARFCYSGIEVVPLQVPLNLPRGAQFAFQALTIIPSRTGQVGPAFSSAIVATIQ